MGSGSFDHGLMRDDIAGGGKSNPADFTRVGDGHRSFSGCGTVFPLEDKRSKKKQRESQCSSCNNPLSSNDLVHHYLSTRLAQSRNFPLGLPPTKSIHASWRPRPFLFVISNGAPRADGKKRGRPGTECRVVNAKICSPVLKCRPEDNYESNIDCLMHGSSRTDSW